MSTDPFRHKQAINSYLVDHPEDLTHDNDGPMTEMQMVELRKLTEAAGEPFDAALSERQAAQRIAYLRDRLGH
jgi:hypothetical protein